MRYVSATTAHNLVELTLSTRSGAGAAVRAQSQSSDERHLDEQVPRACSSLATLTLCRDVSPNMAGGIALLLSALKATNRQWTVDASAVLFSIRQKGVYKQQSTQSRMP